jgi:hypothetical protein
VTPEQVQAHLDELDYKPGWTFHAYAGRWEGMHVAIGARMPDSYHPGQMIDLQVECFLSPNDHASPEALDTWLLYRLARIEVHETREFLRRDGRPVDDPHAEFAERDLP